MKAAAGELFRQPSISSANAASIGPTSSGGPKQEENDHSLSIASAPPRIGRAESQSEGDITDQDADKSPSKLPPINLFFTRPTKGLHPLAPLATHVPVPQLLAGKKRPMIVLPLPRIPQRQASEEQKEEDCGNAAGAADEANNNEMLRQALFKKSMI